MGSMRELVLWKMCGVRNPSEGSSDGRPRIKNEESLSAFCSGLHSHMASVEVLATS